MVNKVFSYYNILLDIYILHNLIYNTIILRGEKSNKSTLNIIL